MYLVASHESTLHDVLQEEDVKRGEDGVRPTLRGLDLVDLRDRLVRVLLGLVHVAGLHAVHHGDQVHKNAQVVLRQPLEIVGDILGDHLFVGRPTGRRDCLDGLLQLLQYCFYGFDLTHHQVITHLHRRG